MGEERGVEISLLPSLAPMLPQGAILTALLS